MLSVACCALCRMQVLVIREERRRDQKRSFADSLSRLRESSLISDMLVDWVSVVEVSGHVASSTQCGC